MPVLFLLLAEIYSPRFLWVVILMLFSTLISRHFGTRLCMDGGAILKAAGRADMLMHDFSAPRRGSDPERHPEYLLHLTEQLIDFAEEGGFNLMRFSDLVDEPASISTTEPA